MKFTILALIILLNFDLMGQGNTSFRESDFPSSKFKIIKESRVLGRITVEIVQVSPINYTLNSTFYCRGWLMVKNGGKVLSEKYYQDMEPVGGTSGLFFPERQPINNLIIVSKFESYDGETILITNKGELSHYGGGGFYVSPDNKYMFSNHDSDLSGVTIIDLIENKLVFEGELNKYLSDWYFQDGKYFAPVWEESRETKDKLTFDFATKQFTLGKIAGELPVENKLKLYNDPRNIDCCCGK